MGPIRQHQEDQVIDRFSRIAETGIAKRTLKASTNSLHRTSTLIWIAFPDYRAWPVVRSTIVPLFHALILANLPLPLQGASDLDFGLIGADENPPHFCPPRSRLPFCRRKMGFTAQSVPGHTFCLAPARCAGSIACLGFTRPVPVSPIHYDSPWRSAIGTP